MKSWSTGRSSSREEQKEPFLPIELGTASKQPTNYFYKTLTASDTSTHGGFSLSRQSAEKVLPQLDFSLQPPCQELIARDLHGNEMEGSPHIPWYVLKHEHIVYVL